MASSAVFRTKLPPLMVMWLVASVSSSSPLLSASVALQEALRPLQLMVSLLKALSFQPLPVVISKLPPLMVRSWAAWMPSLAAWRVKLPPVMVMQPAQPAAASTASGSERMQSPPAALTVISPPLTVRVLSLEMPFFTELTSRHSPSMVRLPDAPTFRAFLELHTSLSVPAPLRVSWAPDLALITADSAYSALLPSPPSSVGP